MGLECKIKDNRFATKKKQDFNTFKESNSQKTKTEINNIIDIYFNYSLLNQNFIITDRIANLNEVPKLNESLKVYTTKNINSIEILEVINKKYKIKNVLASFATINKVAVNEINKYKVSKIYARCNTEGDGFYTKLVNDINCTEKIKLKSHFKAFLIECDNYYFTVITSANPSISSRFEIYTIYNSKNIYEMYLDAFKKLEK